jgi:VWFA-related protein
MHLTIGGERGGKVVQAKRRFATAGVVGLAVLVSLLDGAGAIPAAADAPAGRGTPAPTFAAATDVIRLDAVVTDKQGREVKGLRVGDFVVREDGEPQVLTSFEAVDLASAPTAQAPQPARSGADDSGSAQSTRRVFILVMDDGDLSLAGAIVARKAAKQFLSAATRPGDLVTLVVADAGLTWSTELPEGRAQLASIIDSVSGRQALSAERAGGWDTGEWNTLMAARRGAPLVRAEAQNLLNEDRERRRQLFKGTLAALDAVASVKRRKAVVLFSEGFIQEPDDEPFRDLVAAMLRENAALYFVDVQRLTSGLSWRRVNPQDSAGAEVVAEETGGFTVRDLEAGLARIARECSIHYLLGYSPKNQKADGKYRRLEVEVRRADLNVRARKGYYGPSQDDSLSPSRGEPDADPALQRVLADAVPAREIPLRLATFTLQTVEKRKVRVRLVAEVGLKSLRFERDRNGLSVATLDWAMVLNHVEAAGRQRLSWREWKVKVPPQAEGLAIWAAIEGSFEVPGGACQAKLVVRDRRSRALGRVLHSFEVPDPDSWRVSTPILSDMPGQEPGGPPRMLVGRSFVAGAPLYCYLEVYGGAGKKRTAAPRASLAYALVDARGRTKRKAPASPLALNSSGIPTRLETIPLAGLSPGEYELRLTVTDAASDRAQELRETFVVRRPTHPDLAIYLELLQAFLAGDVARAAAGVMEWRPEDLEKLAASLPSEDAALRRAALLLHSELAFRLWRNRRGPDADAQIAICRAVLAKDFPPALHRDWLLAVGYYQLAAPFPARALKALAFFEECVRLFPDVAEAWLRAGTCYETAAFPDGFDFGELPAREAARQAERHYREAARLDPSLAEARLRLGRILTLAGALDEAEKELAAAAEGSTEARLTALAQVFWGGVRDARGDPAGAVDHYQAALAAAPESQTAAFALSEALYRSGRRRSAAERLASVVSAPRLTEISDWREYHLGFGPRSGLLPVQAETAPVAAGTEPAGTP